MNKEIRDQLKKKQQMLMLKRNAKALYLLSDLGEAYEYLWAKVDDGFITDEDADQIIYEISDDCKDMTVGEIERLKKLF